MKEELKKDPNADQRKSDHIDLAFASQTSNLDERFSYEPLFGSSHVELPLFHFLGKTLQTPIWCGSMTGGTEKARKINENLARACHDFQMGMGLGSCRQLLENDDRLADFDLRKIIGDSQPFYANLGIAQIEQILCLKKLDQVDRLVDKLQVDGLIVHINPLQEWMQPEGDRLNQTPLETLQKFLEKSDIPLIVKEVGQGFGKESLRALMKLPIQAIEFAAHGGTNFSKLELLRSNSIQLELFQNIAFIGHSAVEMVSYVNEIIQEEKSNPVCNQFIISGGIKNFLDGYYGMQKIHANAIYGQASSLLKYAQESYDTLHDYILNQKKGLQLAYTYFKIKE